MKKTLLILVAITFMATTIYGGPLLWRGPKTIPVGSFIAMGSWGIAQTNLKYDWNDYEWVDQTDAQLTTIFNSHLMFGYGIMKRWEFMMHLPLLYKGNEKKSYFGMQDMYIKTRVNLIGGKKKPFLTAVAALRFPTSNDSAEFVLDDKTTDVGLGLLFMTPKLGPLLIHGKIGYWINTTNAKDQNVGDNLEGILKFDYLFNKHVKAFLNFNANQSFDKKDKDGNVIEKTKKRRLNISPGMVFKPAPGLSIRPKGIIPVRAGCQCGGLFPIKGAIDIWYVLKTSRTKKAKKAAGKKG